MITPLFRSRVGVTVRSPFRVLFVFLLVLPGSFGCQKSDQNVAGPSGETVEAESSLTALEAAQAAAKQQRWDEAEAFIRDALIEGGSNPEVLQLAAEITYATGDSDAAIQYLADASAADQFQDQALVQRATIGFLSVGRLYDAIDFLDQVITAHPQRHQARRQLFDFLVSAEEKYRAVPHGRILVRQRQFDRVLLFSLSTHEQRDIETGSMETLYARNPHDQRLRLAELRSQFDLGNWDELEAGLNKILEQRSENIAAQLLLGRYYVESNRFDRLATWSDRLSPAIEETWQYWEILGDWASHRGKYDEAVRAFWESTRRNLDVGAVFAKLATSLVVLRDSGEAVDEEVIDAVNARAQLISRFNHDKDQFYKSGNQSNAIAADVARSLAALGRYWEAEAWAALAMTIPDEDVEQAVAVRKEILKKLRKDLPWQVAQGHPVVDLDLSQFRSPQIAELAANSGTENAESFRPSLIPVLTDQAVALGLVEASTQVLSPADEAIPIFRQMESGGCAPDFDLDGWPDLYVAESGGTPGQRDSQPNHLFRNRNGTFEDVTRHAAVADNGFAQGVTFGDINEDGFPDVVVLNYGRNRLFINNGDGTFRSADRWLPSQQGISWSTSAAIADFNGDAISDLFCSRYCAGVDAVETVCREQETGRESPCLPTKFAAARDQIFAGTSTGGFREVTGEWSDAPVQLGRGLGVVAGSLDSRPGIDVFVANDMTDNHFWSPTGGEEASPFRMIESATLHGLALDSRFRPQACMGIATGDLDSDGDVDFLVTNFEQEHNTFYEQTVPDIWSDQTTQRGIWKTSYSQLGFGTQAVDFDNDSHLEIMIANGHVYRDAEPPSSYLQRVQILRRGSASDFEAMDLAASGDYLNRDHVGRALWTIDANRDGRVDIGIIHQAEPLALLINETASDHAWIRVQLVGRQSTRDAIGARVTVRRGGLTRMAPLVSGDGFYCANERVLHFGLGSPGAADGSVEIEVRWPGGEVQKTSAGVNTRVLIVQGQAAFAL